MNVEAVVTTAAGGTVILGFVGVALQRAYHLAQLIEGRSKQLEPNGGSSLRDDMTHVRNSIDTIGAQLRAVSVDVLGVHARLEGVEQRLDDHEAEHREAGVTA